MAINSPLTTIPRITKPQLAALKKLGIKTIQELLFYFPFRYIDFRLVKSIKELKPDEDVSIQVFIKDITSRFSFKTHLSIAEAVVSDETGSIKVVWFNQGYLSKVLEKDDEIFLSGKPEYYKGSFQFSNPMWEKVSDFPVHTARLVPIYHVTAGLLPKQVRGLVSRVIERASDVPETLPQDILKRNNLPAITETIRFSHFPKSVKELEAARKRLAFEEIFLSQLAVQRHKMLLQNKPAATVPFDQTLIKEFLSTLPFELTPGQKKAAWDILQDIEKPNPMNRLVEGDVGSGKTIVALMAALQMVRAGYQVAFLAPTEILAKQHFETAKKYVCTFDAKVQSGLLTHTYSNLNGVDMPAKKLQALISEGMPGLYIGTQALLQSKVTFKNLGLVIIDEQHRFGVEQRAQLMERKQIPHLLSLTATPIPRTLQLAAFGDLDFSPIKGKPANRKLIFTKLVVPTEREKAYAFIEKQIQDDRQAFVITPLIEESETLDVKSAKTEQINLQAIFPKLTIGLLHGKLKGKEKEHVMADFLAKKIDVLVSTSVVEVGVDVPNASVMVIEGADRFGLAQLHQFRGRVGRAEHQSYCFLFTENQNPETIQRLELFTKTNDGFELAELDLQQRGFGELYGAKQSGWNFKYFNTSYTSLIEPAREEALAILKKDFDLKDYILLKEKIKGQTIHFE